MGISPSHYLSSTVLRDSDALKTVKLWLSVARCKYVIKKAAFRKPKIWMLTGVYLLHDVRAYDLQKIGPKLSAGVSPQFSALTGGVPIGGSVGFEWERELEADLRVPDANIWAAQWRKLDVEYLLDGNVGTTDKPAPLQFGLYPDVTSQGVLRSHDAATGQSWRAVIGPTLNELTNDRSLNYICEESAPGIETENESSQIYDRSFQEALDWFAGEIDDDVDDDEDEIERME